MTDQPVHDAPTCPRHPGVVSYVRCARCGRPACPQCQRPAAVGIHCVDCVRESARTAPQARTSLGAPMTAVAQGAPVTLGLVVACAVVFLLQQLSPTVTGWLAFSPLAGRVEPWRFVTAAFLHGGWTHIVFNMLALWTVGQGLERAMGAWRYLALYLVSAVGGSVGFLLFATTRAMLGAPSGFWEVPWQQWTVGASGAVFGLFGAVLVLAGRTGQDLRSMLVWLGINVLIGFTVPGIAWQAHLGGFVTGAAIAGLVYATRTPERRRWQWPAIGAVLALLVVLALAKYALTTLPAGWFGTL